MSRAATKRGARTHLNINAAPSDTSAKEIEFSTVREHDDDARHPQSHNRKAATGAPSERAVRAILKGALFLLSAHSYDACEMKYFRATLTLGFAVLQRKSTTLWTVRESALQNSRQQLSSCRGWG